METISNIKAREILDSRGDPTIEVELETSSHIKAITSVPSGASIGSHEVIELRDNDPQRFEGMGVLKAVQNVLNKIAPAIIGMDVTSQKEIDDTLVQLDGTPHKSNLGGNATLAVSQAAVKAGAIAKNLSLFRYVAQLSSSEIKTIPRPMFNFIEGAKHADNNLVIQEFMVIPDKETFAENYRQGSEIFHKLRKILKDKNLSVAVGHEGGFAPTLSSDEDAIKLIQESEKIYMGLDLAGIIPNGMNLEQLVNTYPIIALEDPMPEDDWNAWVDINSKLSSKIMIIADDLLATSMERLKECIEKKAANAVIVKPNQIGTVSETIEFAKYAKDNNLKLVVSHRSGETEDSFISDFAVGIQAQFCKFGAPARGERVCKYNRLLRIEEEIVNG